MLQHNQNEVGDAGDHVEEVGDEEEVDEEVGEEGEIVVEEKDDDVDEEVSPTKGTTTAA